VTRVLQIPLITVVSDVGATDTINNRGE
jgi:hypothetical protein